MNLTHFGSCFEKIHYVSASQLEVLVTWCFPSREMPRKQELVVDHWWGVFLYVNSFLHFSVGPLWLSSREGKQNVTKTSSWEAETSGIVSKHDPKWLKFIHFNMDIGSNNTFSKEEGCLRAWNDGASFSPCSTLPLSMIVLFSCFHTSCMRMNTPR